MGVTEESRPPPLSPPLKHVILNQSISREMSSKLLFSAGLKRGTHLLFDAQFLLVIPIKTFLDFTYLYLINSVIDVNQNLI